MKGNTTKKNGFTLIELLIVMVVIGIITAIAIPAFTGQSHDDGTTHSDSQTTQHIDYN